MAAQLIDTEDQVKQLVSLISRRRHGTGLIFLDLEGVNLSRRGTIAIMQLLLPPSPVVYLVDIHVLANRAFTTKDEKGTSLKTVLEAPGIAKCLFDVRNDSDALFGLFGVSLRGAVDIQILEFVSRQVWHRYLTGLGKCIAQEKNLLPSVTKEHIKIKENGLKLFAPEKGGSYEVFLERPLRPEIVAYCAQDVLLLPPLLALYASRLTPNKAGKIQAIVDERIKLSQSPSFNGKGKHMTLGPKIPKTKTPLLQLTFPMSLICSYGVTDACRLDPNLIPDTLLAITSLETKLNSEEHDKENVRPTRSTQGRAAAARPIEKEFDEELALRVRALMFNDFDIEDVDI